MPSLQYPRVGVCGLSCRLCPRYHTNSASRCEGCKTPSRMNAACSLANCAIKKRGVEFCWQCNEYQTCPRARKLQEFSSEHDSFKCYQKLAQDIAYILRNGIIDFENDQAVRETLLRTMLAEFDDGRSKSYYCIAATVMEIKEMENSLREATANSTGLNLKDKAKCLHLLLDSLAEKKSYHLKLRK